MEDYEIPNHPLKMPQRGNLYREPKHPYKYDTSGIIRGKDFGKLLQIIKEEHQDKQQFKAELDSQLGYHHISDMFEEWDLQKTCDFARHVLIANKNELGWDLVDETVRFLDGISIPGWRLPNFDFIEEFDLALNQIHKIYFPDRLRTQIGLILEEVKLEEIQLDKNVKKHLHLWSIKDLWLLLSYITSSDKVKNEKTRQIINLVSNKFEELIDSDNIPIKRKVCLILAYIDAIAGLNKEYTIRSKELIDKVWISMKDLDYSVKISFKYLLGAAYSLVGEQLFKQNTDFVTRKLFIDNFIQNYVIEEYDLGQWFADLLDYDMNELIFDLLIRGYSKTIPLLHNHSIELPESNTKNNIELRIKQFNGVLAEIIIYYLGLNEKISDDILIRVYKEFQDKFVFEKTKSNMIELLYSVTKSSVFYNNDFSKEKKDKLFKLTSYLLSKSMHKCRAMIFEIDYKLNSGTYDFENKYKRIKLEVSKSKSLILSATFEKEIIRKVSDIIQYTDTVATRNEIYLEIFQITLQYLLEWLKQFSQDKYDFKEALMIFAPLINITFYQQIRYYYENKFSKKSFLMNLNLHSFMEYFSHKLNEFDKMKFKQMRISHRKNMSDKYKELTDRWQVRDLLNNKQIKEMIIDTREKFNTSGLKHKSSTGNLIEDAIIHGYLDEIDRLERFIHNDYSMKEDFTFEEILVESGIFREGKKKSHYRLERATACEDCPQVIPVPLFNNIHRLSIATELFKLKTPEAESLQKRNEKIQEEYQAIN